MLRKPTSAAFRHTLPLGLMLVTLGLTACNSGNTPSSQAASTNAAAETATFDYDGQDHSWTATATGTGAQGAVATLTLNQGLNSLSYENYTSATNGWGPVERNMSVGEKNSGDGHTLTLAGKTYTKGFGVHANSSMTFNIASQCSIFTSDIGVDDEVGSRGSVIFQVFADGTKLYDSGVMTGASATKSLSVNVSGKKELKLVVTDAGNGISYDHADWASPQITCTGGKTTVSGSVAPAPAPTPTPTPTPAPAPSGTVTYSGPITITKGGTYSGNWESTTTATAVTINTKDPVIIQNSNIRGRGNLISGFGNSLTVRNTRGYNLNPNVAGKTAGRAVNAENFVSVRVENNYFEGSTGIYLRHFSGSSSQSTTISILRNQFRNIDGRQSNGSGGYNGKTSVVQAILFNDVKRTPNVEIAWNEIINEPGKSRTEETMNFYVSGGTPSSPFQIHDNYIHGAYGIDPIGTASYPGGGILLGDGKVTDPLDAGYARVHDNQIVGTTNHGMAIVGGVDNQMYNNRVIGSGLTPTGQPMPATNVGIYVWDQNNAGKASPATFAKNKMINNVVGWTRVASNGKTTNNPTWLPSCGVQGSSCSGNQDIGTVTLAMEQAEYTRWQSKLASSNIKVGP